MTLVDAGLGELPVHMPSCRFVGEPVTGTACHPFYALLDRWQQHGVVQALDACGSNELGQEPRPDNTVVHGDVPAGDVTASSGGRRPSDHLILAVGCGQPRCDGASGKEGEEGVTADEHASLELVRERAGDR